MQGWADEFGTIEGVTAGTCKAGEERFAASGVGWFERGLCFLLCGESYEVGLWKMGGPGEEVERGFDYAGGEGEIKIEDVGSGELIELESESTAVIREREGFLAKAVLPRFAVPAVVTGAILFSALNVEEAEGRIGGVDGLARFERAIKGEGDLGGLNVERDRFGKCVNLFNGGNAAEIRGGGFIA